MQDAPPGATARLRPILWRLVGWSEGNLLDADAEELGQTHPVAGPRPRYPALPSGDDSAGNSHLRGQVNLRPAPFLPQLPDGLALSHAAARRTVRGRRPAATQVQWPSG